MALAPFHADRVRVQMGLLALVDFDPAWAGQVASWVTSDGELLWLAPKTEPPLTAEKVILWPGPLGRSMLLWQEGLVEPIGYAELNPMPSDPAHLWIGHCILRPDARGQGLGHNIVQMLIYDAFVNRKAPAVSLVVFPENIPAVRCYRANGFVHVREQIRYLPSTGRSYCMIEMCVRRDAYQRLRAAAD